MTEAGGNGKCTINSHLHFDQMFSLSINNRNVDIVYSSKNALTAAVSLACLVIRSRNKEAINSTRNRVYSLTEGFSPLTLSTVKYSSGCLLFNCF